MTDKIGVIEAFLEQADAVLIGGAMCFPFFAAQGHDVGSSLCEEEGIEPARQALLKSEGKLHLPIDLVLADAFSADAERREIGDVDVPDGWMGLDIGGRTATPYATEIRNAGTVFWNGPLGAFEMEPFAAGTGAVAEAVADTAATTVSGAATARPALVQFGLADRVTHLSTGGGASLELLEASRCRASRSWNHEPHTADRRHWKMNKTVAEAEEFVAGLLPRISSVEDVDVASACRSRRWRRCRRLDARLAPGGLRPEHARGRRGRLHRRDLGGDAPSSTSTARCSATPSGASTSARPTRRCR